MNDLSELPLAVETVEQTPTHMVIVILVLLIVLARTLRG